MRLTHGLPRLRSSARLLWEAGDFASAEERVRVIRRRGNWLLQARGGPGRGGKSWAKIIPTRFVKGTARCLYYDQLN